MGFGIIGAGAIAHIHARAIAAIPNAQLKAVYNTGADKGLAFARTFNCSWYPELDLLLADPEVDIVCICTPSGAHLEPALAVMQAGKHCLIEKPLEITVDRCNRIIDAAGEAGVKLGVVFPARFYEESKRIKAALEKNRFGKLCLGSAYVKWHRSEEYYQSGKWRGTWQLDGGGALMNQGIHSVDLLQWYMGPVQQVYAFASQVRHTQIEVEDTLVAVLHFASGALGTLECSTAVFPGSPKRIEILGVDGTAVLEEADFIKWVFRNGEETPVAGNDAPVVAGGASDPAGIGHWAHQKQLEDFIDAVANNRDPLIDGVEGRKAVEIVAAIYQSVRTGRSVSLPGNA